MKHLRLYSEFRLVKESEGGDRELNIDWSLKEIKPRGKDTIVLFLSPEKIFKRISTDSPDFDIKNNPNLRISNRLEKAKEYLLNHDEQEMKFVPTQVYLDPYRKNLDGEPCVCIEDGRHRLLAALELGLKEFPIEVYPRDEEYFKKNF